MTIPTAHCNTWSNPGAVTTARTTHEAIRRALVADRSPIRGHNVDVYLQGSYKNDTNTRGDSDVDIVVELNETFYYEDGWLPQPEREAFHRQYPGPPQYSWWDFDRDVTAALRLTFGAAAVTPDTKCIRVAAGGGRLSADVVVAANWRNYVHFRGAGNEQYAEGIAFFGRGGGGRIVNYPRYHYDNGVTKNTATGGNYKPSVRMIKNARNYLVDHHEIPDNIAPSYFVECMLYNVPDDLFVADRHTTFYNVLHWLESAGWPTFMSQNRRWTPKTGH